jgi:hypothetical protein
MRQRRSRIGLNSLGWIVELTLLGALVCAPTAGTTKEIVQPPKKAASKNATAAQEKKVEAKPTINKKEVNELYNAGEFDQIIALLETMRRERGLRDKDDSIFIYKYLGVVYGADMATRRKAESFLYQMLKLDPKQDLVDLEVGDAILNIFQEVRKRYERTSGDTTSPEERQRIHKSLKAYGYPIDSTGKNLIRVSSDSSSKVAGSGTSTPTSSQSSTGAASSNLDNERTWMWVAGGAAAVTLAGVATLLLLSEPEVKTKTYETDLK